MKPSQPAQPDWDAQRYGRDAAFVSELGQDLLQRADPQPGETIIDLGCGDGTLAVKLAERGAQVVGVDLSPKMVAATRERSIEALCADATQLSEHFEPEYADLVFSNAAMHWVQNWQAMLTSIHQCLKRRGRLVAEFGTAGNIQLIRQALHRALQRRGHHPAPYDPWLFPQEDSLRLWLEQCGFEHIDVQVFKRDTYLQSGMGAWLRLMAQPFLVALSQTESQTLLQEVEEELAPQLFRCGKWYADYVRCRLIAYKPSIPSKVGVQV